MKALRFTFLIMALSLAWTSNAQNPFFEKWNDRPDVSYVYISKGMMKMVAKSNMVNEAIKKIAPKLEGIYVMTINNGSSMAHEEFVRYIKSNRGYELLLDEHSSNESKTIYVVKGRGNSIKELLMESYNRWRSCKYTLLKGNMTLQEIQDITDNRRYSFLFNDEVANRWFAQIGEGDSSTNRYSDNDSYQEQQKERYSEIQRNIEKRQQEIARAIEQRNKEIEKNRENFTREFEKRQQDLAKIQEQRNRKMTDDIQKRHQEVAKNLENYMNDLKKSYTLDGDKIRLKNGDEITIKPNSSVIINGDTIQWKGVRNKKIQSNNHRNIYYYDDNSQKYVCMSESEDD